MDSNNKYGSYTDTLIGDPLINILLSTKATPPADLTLIQADFVGAVNLYSSSGGLFAPRNKFETNDSIRFVSIGLWCNLADGLVQIQNPDTISHGLVLGVDAQAYASPGVVVLPSLFGIYNYKLPEFNSNIDVSYSPPMNTVDYTLTGPPGTPGSYFILTAAYKGVDMALSTITIDPQFAAKRLIMRPIVVVEHTFPMRT